MTASKETRISYQVTDQNPSKSAKVTKIKNLRNCHKLEAPRRK
jgi:hypothetical protein